MNLYLLWLVALIVGGFITGFVKSLLGIKITSTVKHGAIVYDAIDSMISAALGYLILSAYYGHFLT